MAKAGKTSSLGVVGQQRPLSVKERQFIAAIRREAGEAEKSSPGTIHAVRFSCSAKSVDAEVVFDRDRERGDRAKRGAADKAAAPGGLPPRSRADQPKGTGQPRPPPTQGNSQQRKPRDSAASGGAKSKTSTAPKADLSDTMESMQLDEDSKPEADSRLSKVRVKALEAAVKRRITATVRSMGGDAKTGGALLEQKRTYKVGAYKAILRLVKSSPAADTPQEEFEQMLEGCLLDGDPDVDIDDGLEFYLEPTEKLPADEAGGDGLSSSMEGCQPASAGC